MKKKLCLLLMLLILFCSQSIVKADHISELTREQFLKFERINANDLDQVLPKFTIFYSSLTILFILIIIVTIFYFKKKMPKMLIPSYVISGFLLLLGAMSLYSYIKLPSDAQKVSKTIVSEISNKTYIENRFLLDQFAKNDYGFTLDYIKVDSTLLQPGKTYSLSYKVTFSFPFNAFGNITRYFKYDFKYEPKNNTQVTINYSNETIKPYKVIRSNNFNISEYTTYCFNQNDLDKYNNSNHISVFGKKGDKFLSYEFNYDDIYSNSQQRIYCSKIYHDEIPYLGYNDNKNAYLLEVK